MNRLGLGVFGFSECRWNRSGAVTSASGHLFVFSGWPGSSAWQRGVEQKNTSMVSWSAISNRIITVCLRTRAKKDNKCSMLCTYQASKSRGKRSGLLITERNRPEYSRDLRAKVGSDNRCQRKWCDTQWFLPSTTISHRRNHFSTRRLGHHRTELYRTKLITFP